MKFLFTADLHLKEIGDERWEALKEVCEEAKKLQCEHLIIGGDLFDEPKDVRKLGQEMGDEIFNNYNFLVHIIPGNHDFEAYTQNQYFGNRVKVYLDYTYLDFEKLRFHFFPFQMNDNALAKMLVEYEKNKNEKNIVVLHTNLNIVNFVDKNEKNYQYMESDLDDFANKDIDVVLAGHIHSGFKKYGYSGGTFYYAGSPVSITKKEIGKRHAIYLEIKNSDIEVKAIPLNTFHYEYLEYLFTLNDNEILSQIENDIKKIDEKSRIIIFVNGIVKGNENIIREKIDSLLTGKNIEDRQILIYEISKLKENSIFKDFYELVENDKELSEKAKVEIIKEFIFANERG